MQSLLMEKAMMRVTPVSTFLMPEATKKESHLYISEKEKKKNVFVHKLSFSIDQANSAAIEVAAKIDTNIAPNDNAGVACVEKLLFASRLECQTPLYFYVCTLLEQKRYRDMLSVMKDVNEKFKWIEW